MHGSNPDQHTEPQSGLEPIRNLDDLFELFKTQTQAKYSAFSVNKWAIFLWEKFKEERGLPAILR